MSTNMTTYSTPKWGSRVARIAAISQDGDGTYYVDDVAVADVRNVNLFSVLACADGTTHVVLTAFFRLIRHERELPIEAPV